jgi:hypothetical protein
MLFIVDCLNYSAQKELGYRTEMEMMFGSTPSISMFRFRFWEPVWYFEPTAKYPSPNFLPGRFVGIAWDHGDAFTYRIWTEPKGTWEDGPQLVRDVVQSRELEATEPYGDYRETDLLLTRKTKTRVELRKDIRNNKSKRRRQNPEEPENERQQDRNRVVSFSGSPPQTKTTTDK